MNEEEINVSSNVHLAFIKQRIYVGNEMTTLNVRYNAIADI